MGAPYKPKKYPVHPKHPTHDHATHEIRLVFEDGSSPYSKNPGIPQTVVDPAYNVYGPKSKISPRDYKHLDYPGKH